MPYDTKHLKDKIFATFVVVSQTGYDFKQGYKSKEAFYVLYKSLK